MNGDHPKRRGLRPLLPWVGRAAYVSIILAMFDTWSAAEFDRPVFSTNSWKMRDGGTTGHMGFGYELIMHRKLGGEHGPEVRFFLVPFGLCYTTEKIGVRWPWNS